MATGKLDHSVARHLSKKTRFAGLSFDEAREYGKGILNLLVRDEGEINDEIFRAGRGAGLELRQAGHADAAVRGRVLPRPGGKILQLLQHGEACIRVRNCDAPGNLHPALGDAVPEDVRADGLPVRADAPPLMGREEVRDESLAGKDGAGGKPGNNVS